MAGLVVLGLGGSVLPSTVPGYASALYLITAALVAVALMASIIAHELGHSIVAQRNRVGVKSINLFALGGVAALEREPDDPGAAGRIAVAGPAVSVAVGVASFAAMGLAGFFGAPALVTAGLGWLGIINIVMAVFNMLPALPLDGGRTLQAVLWKRSGDRHQATIRAAGVGRFIGWSMVAFGAWQFFSGGSGLWTAVMGWFIASSARAEDLRARFLARQEQLARSGGGMRSPFGWFQPPAHWAPPRPEDRVGGAGPIEVSGHRVG
jgi:Zn-dependent protease